MSFDAPAEKLTFPISTAVLIFTAIDDDDFSVRRKQTLAAGARPDCEIQCTNTEQHGGHSRNKMGSFVAISISRALLEGFSHLTLTISVD